MIAARDESYWRRFVGLASLALVLFSVPAAPPAWYVPINLAATAVLLAVAVRAGLTTPELGLQRRYLRPGLLWGAGVALAAAVGIVIGAATPWTRPLFDDARVEGIGLGLLAYRALIRIPFGTAVLEEVAFRGVLFGAWRRLATVPAAAVGSSLVFGLWHIRPTLDLLAANDVAGGRIATTAAVAAAVAGTAAAGVFFCWLRVRSNSLIAPLLAHATINSLAIVAAYAV